MNRRLAVGLALDSLPSPFQNHLLEIFNPFWGGSPSGLNRRSGHFQMQFSQGVFDFR